MALMECKDCKKAFSTDANRCPNCGANKPQAAKSGCLRIIGITIVVIGIIGVIGSMVGGNRSSLDQQRFKDYAIANKDKLRTLIDDDVKFGIIKEIITDGKYVEIYVRQPFYSLDYDAKAGIAKTILSYYSLQIDHLDMVFFRDARTDKSVGHYSIGLGLTLD